MLKYQYKEGKTVAFQERDEGDNETAFIVCEEARKRPSLEYKTFNRRYAITRSEKEENNQVGIPLRSCLFKGIPIFRVGIANYLAKL